MPAHRRVCARAQLARACTGAAIVAAFSPPLRAQTTEPPQLIVISGSGAAQRAFDTPYAVSVVDAQTLREAGPMVNLSEALGRVPGLVVNLRNNYAQDLQISSRGFGARASFGVRGMRLYSDGIPAAGPDGQGQVSHFDIAGAERIEVLRGPFSALYGNGSGGVISLVTRAPTQRTVELDADAGGAGLRQMRMTVAAPLDKGLSVRASVSGFEVDGFRPQSAARRTLANVRLGYDAGREHVVVVLNHIKQPALDPLGLTRAQFDADPEQTTSAALPQDAPGQPGRFNTRKHSTQSQAGLQWQHDFAGDGALLRSALAVYGGARSVTQWQSIPVATQMASADQPGGVIDLGRHYSGIDARLFWRWNALRLVTGAAFDEQQEVRRGFENFIGSGARQVLGVTGALRRDENNLARSRDVYAQAEFDLSESLTASAGLRHGRLVVASDDRFLNNGDDSGSLSYAYTNPVAALRWQATDDWNLYLSTGRGYESPTLNELAYRSDGQPGFNSALQAQRSQQWELGGKWHKRSLGLALELALFQASTRDEIGVRSNTGGRSTYQNVGHTQRRGAELALRWQASREWRAQLSASLLDATYSDGFFTCAGPGCANANVPVASGKRIAGTLPRSGFAELVWTPGASEWALEASARGRQPVNDLNSDFAAGYALVALRASWHADFGRSRIELLGRIDNLADRRVAGSVIVGEGNGRYFEPAAGRSGLVSLRFSQRF